MTVPIDPETHTFSVHTAVRSDGGGWMRLEDYCNNGPRGNELHYTSGLILADEELLGIELGWRVANAIVEKSIDSWDALMDARYDEDMRSGL